jgi:hypothetical protein
MTVAAFDRVVDHGAPALARVHFSGHQLISNRFHMSLAFHSPVSIEHSVFAENFDPALQPDIAAGRSNHDLKFTSLDHPLVVHIGEIQHIDWDGKTHLSSLSGPQSHPLKGLQFLYGTNE